MIFKIIILTGFLLFSAYAARTRTNTHTHTQEQQITIVSAEVGNSENNKFQ